MSEGGTAESGVKEAELASAERSSSTLASAWEAVETVSGGALHERLGRKKLAFGLTERKFGRDPEGTLLRSLSMGSLSVSEARRCRLVSEVLERRVRALVARDTASDDMESDSEGVLASNVVQCSTMPCCATVSRRWRRAARASAALSSVKLPGRAPSSCEVGDAMFSWRAEYPERDEGSHDSREKETRHSAARTRGAGLP